jgi:two-component system chemotaxis sensor kinase CheA
MGSSLGESWTAENIDSAVSLISQLAEELAFVVPDRDSGLLAINALTMDLEQLAELDGPTGFVAGVKVLRVWIDAILDGPVSFSSDVIEKLGNWHGWMSSLLVALDQDVVTPPLPADWSALLSRAALAPVTASQSSTSASVVVAPVAQPEEIEPAASFVLDIDADQELLREFFSESVELLQDIEQGVLVLEEKPGDKNTINSIFRAFHTFKGGAGFLHLAALGELAHELETLLDAVRKGELSINREIIESILAGGDALKLFTREIGDQLDGIHPGAPISVPTQHILKRVRAALRGEAPAAAVAVAKAAEPVPPAAVAEVPAAAPAPPPALVFAPATVVPVAAPVSVVAAPQPVGPLVQLPVAKQAAPAVAAAAESAGAVEPAAKASREGGGSTGGFVKLDTEKLDSLVNLVGELVIAQSMVVQNPDVQSINSLQLLRCLRQLSRVTTELQRNAMSLRMVPIRNLFQKMGRLVRDLGVSQNKQVQLVLEGEETELDRNIVEKMGDPLIHMIRNSVDHGLEGPDERLANGKPAMGTVRLSASHQRGGIVIRIQDDGRGLNTDSILAKAIERGLVRPNAGLSESEIHALIFLPGFSTAEAITDLSGRGVGMDVVRGNIESLRGKVEIESVFGKGTTFTILLPLTLAIIDGLLVAVGEDRYIIPTLSVRESFRLRPGMVSTVHERGEMVTVRGKQTPLLRLGRFLGSTSKTTQAEDGIIVVVESGDTARGLLVDELIGKQEVVIKSLGPAFEHQNLAAGGAVLGDGWVALILDVDTLVKLPIENRASVIHSQTGTHS